MTSHAQKIHALADRLSVGLRELFAHSQIYDRTDNGIGPVTPRPFSWNSLPLTARPLQNETRDLFGQFIALAEAAFENLPSSVKEEADKRHGAVLRLIDQDHPTEFNTVEKVEKHALDAIAETARVITERASGNPAETLIIPDTNALYAWPDLDRWTFADTGRFAVVLAPAVMGEIDLHKDDRRKQFATRRQKAERHVRQIKGYRERAERAGRRLADGTTLRDGRSRVMSWGRPPNMDRALAWLDRTRADDNLLASAMEISSKYALSPVAILTRDVNFQNRCDFAHMSLAPEPTLT
jgi:hypothetical protein